MIRSSLIQRLFDIGLYFIQGPRFYGGSPAQNTTSTVSQTKLPDYAQPYYSTLMGASTNQIFNTDASGNITGTRPYVPYSSNPSDYIASFSPLQQQAFQGYSNLNLPNQFNPATQLAATSGAEQLNTSNQAAGYGAQGSYLVSLVKTLVCQVVWVLHSKLLIMVDKVLH